MTRPVQSVECQRADWKQHKVHCMSIKSAMEFVKPEERELSGALQRVFQKWLQVNAHVLWGWDC